MSKIQRFEDIEAWQAARKLVSAVYKATSNGKFARDFSLRDQVRRAGVSIMSNIAEGFERDGNKEFLQFLSVAKGSSGELRAQLYIALDQAYLTQQQFDSMTNQGVLVGRMIGGLIRYLRQSELRGRKFL